MMNFELSILGTGSAIPSFGRFSSAQVLHTHNKSFLIDCADGTQFQLRKYGIKTNRMNHWFISHLHGDHCYGIISVLSTLGMLHHTGDIHIHAHPDLEPILKAQLDYFCKDLSFQVHFEPLNPLKSEVIYEDRSLTVTTIPLVHSMPTCGFLFKEKMGNPHLNRELLDFYKVGIEDMKNLRNGADFTTQDGQIIPNSRFITPPTPPKSYAYCSDTAYSERIIPIIQGADVLFHEATFAESEAFRTKETLHSTAKQAATIAQKAGVKQLIIGHYSARYADLTPLHNEAKSIFKNTLLSFDGMQHQW
ncbi:MAG: ribonuclease Z [Paludibacteraceae bacterium]|nr:ribonuclease Z [Paludibacteraceae bacterium]